MQFSDQNISLAMRALAESDLLTFTRYFFKLRERIKFIKNWHHVVVARAFDKVLRGELEPRLIVTMPPGFTKSMLMLDAMARSYGEYGLSRNILINYNSTFARSNSQIMMDTIELPEYQAWWDVTFRADVSAKGRWLTKHGGGLVAAGVNGTITGFRAGRMTPGFFSGGMFIDDPIKPKDANSKAEREKVNAAMNQTIRNRLAIPKTPILLSMQRLHDNDPVGFLLRGGTGETWHHLNIPAKITKEHLKPGKRYARKYPYGEPLLFPDLFEKGWTWPMKVDAAEHAKVKKADPFVASAQLDQEPQLIEGNFIKGKYLHYYRELPPEKDCRRVIAIADTALELNSTNDRTVWQVWGQYRDGRAYLLDYFGARLEVPDVESMLANVWVRWRDTLATGLPRITEFYVEKKASGHGVIQKFRRSGIHVIPIERNNDKVYRAMECIPALCTGTLMLPAKKVKSAFTTNDQWSIMLDELMQFSADMDHAHDDFCDCIFDAGNIFYNPALSVRDLTGR